MLKKVKMNEQSCCFVNLTLLLFSRPRCRRRPHRCLSSPIKRAFQEPESPTGSWLLLFLLGYCWGESPLPTSRERGRERGRHTRTSCDSEPSCKGGKEALDKRIVIDGKNDNSGSHRVGLDLRQYVFAKTSVAYLLMRTFSKVLRCGKDTSGLLWLKPARK